MGYYFSVWGIAMLLIILTSIIAGWIFVTPERVAQWSTNIPPFSITIQDGILTETGFPEEPYTLVDDKGFIIFISKTLSEIPISKQRDGGIFILKDRAVILQDQWAGQKEQIIKYAEIPEMKNAHLDNALLTEGIITQLTTIKRVASIMIAFIGFFVSMMIAVWFCVWSFFWGLFVWLVSRTLKNPFNYEQAVGFVLSVFFPVLILSVVFMVLEISFPFSMTLLFLLMLGYNHLSFYRSETKE